MSCINDCSFQLHSDNETSKFTCQQVHDYCHAFTTWAVIESRIATCVNVSLVIAGTGALISYILMLVVFRYPCFNGATYIYHKSIVVMELVHMLVMAQVGSGLGASKAVSGDSRSTDPFRQVSKDYRRSTKPLIASWSISSC